MRSKKIFSFFLLGSFLIFGLFLRTYRLIDWLPWNSDTGKDFTVAQRAVADGGPYFPRVVSGSASKLVFNSPLYYMIEIFTYSVTNSVIGVCLFYALWNVFGIYLAYRLGTLLKDEQCGFLCSLLIATNYFLIGMSRMIWPPTILPTIVLATLYALLQYIKKKNNTWFILCFLSIVVGSLSYYGYLPIASVATVILVLSMCKQLKMGNYSSRMKKIMLVFLGLISCFLACFVVKTNFYEFLVWIIDNMKEAHPYTQAALIIHELSRCLFYGQHITIGYFAISFSCLMLIWEAISKKNIFHESVILLAFLSTLFFAVFYPEEMHYGRILGYYPILIIMFAYCTSMLCKQKWMFWIIGLSIMYFSVASFGYITASPTQTYQRTKNIVQQIITDIDLEHSVSGVDQDSFAIHYIGSTVDSIDWPVGQYWYFFEAIRKKKYISIINDDNNLWVLQQHPALHYLVCLKNDFDVCDGLATFVEYVRNDIDIFSQVIVTDEVTNGIEHFRIYRWKSP